MTLVHLSTREKKEKEKTQNKTKRSRREGQKTTRKKTKSTNTAAYLETFVFGQIPNKHVVVDHLLYSFRLFVFCFVCFFAIKEEMMMTTTSSSGQQQRQKLLDENLSVERRQDQGLRRRRRRQRRRGKRSLLNASSWMHPQQTFMTTVLMIALVATSMMTSTTTTTSNINGNGDNINPLPVSLSFLFANAYQILGPSTTPEQVIESQLSALQANDMAGVFQFASPANKQNVNNDVKKFGEMVQSGPYRHLLGHERADIMLQSTLGLSKQYLVRVITNPSQMNKVVASTSAPTTKDEKEKVVEYWWSLSRSTFGPNTGCYMVDAVIPNL